jgi:ribosomal protein S18 acetylase RimI-like enzyme
MAGLELRRAVAADRDRLVALVQSAYRGDAARQGWTTEAHLIDGQRVDPAMMDDLLADDHVDVLVGSIDGDTVACCEVRAPQDGGDSASFGMFAVAPSLQGSGLGGRVLAEAERLAAQQMGARRLTLLVIDLREELIAWYRRRGYRLTGERRPFPYDDERFGRPRQQGLAFVVLAKDLTSTTSAGPGDDGASDGQSA